MQLNQCSYLLLLILGGAVLGKEEAKNPTNAPEKALASCVITSRSCRSPAAYTSKQGEHGLELVFNYQTNYFIDLWHNFVSQGHYKSTYWALSDEQTYFKIHSDVKNIENLTDELLAEKADKCNAAVRCYALDKVDNRGFPKDEDHEEK